MRSLHFFVLCGARACVTYKIVLDHPPLTKRAEYLAHYVCTYNRRIVKIIKTMITYYIEVPTYNLPTFETLTCKNTERHYNNYMQTL